MEDLKILLSLFITSPEEDHCYNYNYDSSLLLPVMPLPLPPLLAGVRLRVVGLQKMLHY